MDRDVDPFWEEIKPNLTPLIDGVFLLLIFFMVSMVFARPVRLKVELPEADRSVLVQQRQLKLYVSKEGLLDLEGKELGPGQLESVLRQHVGQGKKVRLTILVDRHTAHGHTLEAMEAAQKAGIDRVYLATKSSATAELAESASGEGE